MEHTNGVLPEVDALFVSNPTFDYVMDILRTKMFFPTLLSGPSGAGKTYVIEQACALEKRPVYRVNITIESDEDALMGGFRLKDGSTVFERGPIVKAMEEGAILLLDEIDLGSPTKIMCLQSVLEGKGYYIKRTQEWSHPKEGFQVFATANTKGLGDDTGGFVGTQNLNEAFLERFPVTLEVDYVTPEVEREIVGKVFASMGHQKDKFVDILVRFANQVRKSYTDQSIEHTVSTRRLIHIARAYGIWQNEEKAVQACLSRFDTHTKNAFLDIYHSISPLSDKERAEMQDSVIEDLSLNKFKPYS